MSEPRVEPDISFYDEAALLYPRLVDDVIFTLRENIDFKIHSILGRVKERSSVVDKILDRGYMDPGAQLTDIVGVRIVCLFASDLPKLETIVSTSFDVIEVVNKITDASPDSFGYMSVHYVCKLKSSSQGAHYTGLHGIKFEIQSRTILMDAWANVSHHLAYKGTNSIPLDKRRAFHALAGLFYVADSQFEQLVHVAPPAAATVLQAETGHESASRTLDREAVGQVIDQVFPGRPREKDQDAYLSSVSDFVEEARAAGIFSVEGLQKALEANKTRALDLEKAASPKRKADFAFYALGIARIALRVASRTL